MASKEELVEKLVPVLTDLLGVKISKENSWKVFKAGIDAAVACAVEDKDLALSLSGVGKFEVIKAVPRSSKGGLVDFVPRLRFRPSIRVDQLLEEKFGQVPDPVKLAAAKARINEVSPSHLPRRSSTDAKEDVVGTSAGNPREEEFSDAF